MGGGGLSDAGAALRQPVAYGRLLRAGGTGRVEGGIGLHRVPEAAQVMDGLAGAAHSVLLGVGEPIQARGIGYRIELLTDQEPLGQVWGDVRRGDGHEAVFGVGAEAEVVRQVRGLSSRVTDTRNAHREA